MSGSLSCGESTLKPRELIVKVGAGLWKIDESALAGVLYELAERALHLNDQLTIDQLEAFGGKGFSRIHLDLTGVGRDEASTLYERCLCAGAILTFVATVRTRSNCG